MKKKEIIKALCKSLNDDDLLNFLDSTNFIFDTLENGFEINNKDKKELIVALAAVDVITKGLAARLDIINEVDRAEEELILDIITANIDEVVNNKDLDIDDFDFDNDLDESDDYDSFEDFDDFEEFDETEYTDEDGTYESWIDDDEKENDKYEEFDEHDESDESDEFDEYEEYNKLDTGAGEVEGNKEVSADDFISAFADFNKID